MLDLTGKNIATLKDTPPNEVRLLIDIGTSDAITDVFTESGSSTMNPAVHIPIDGGGARSAPDGVFWRADTGNTLVLDQSTDKLHHNSAVAKARKGIVIDGRSPHGRLSLTLVPYRSGSLVAIPAPRFRYTGVNGTGLLVRFTDTTVSLQKETPNGTFTSLASASYSVANGVAIAMVIDAQGDDLSVWLDGVLTLSYTTTFNHRETFVGLMVDYSGAPSDANTATATADLFVWTPGLYLSPTAYTLDMGADPDITYRSLIPEDGIGEISMSGPEGGGLAEISGCTFKVVNQGFFSSEVEAAGFLRGRPVILYLLMIDGSEDHTDRLARFTGHVRGVTGWDMEVFTVECETNQERDLTPFPKDVVSLDVYPNAAMDAMGKPLPVCFGNLNVFNKIKSNPITLMPTILTDIYLRRYCIHGQNNAFESVATSFTPIWFDNSLRKEIVRGSTDTSLFAVSVDTTGNRGVQINTNERGLYIRPLRPYSGNTFTTTWKNVTDGDTATNVELTAGGGEKIAVGFAAMQYPGTITSAKLVVVKSADIGIAGCIIRKDGTITDSFSASSGTTTTTLTLATWSDWQFGAMSFEAIHNSGLNYIQEVYILLTYQGTEQFRNSESPVFMAGTGYIDTASRYANGATITGAATVLRNPSTVLQAILRDKPMGWGLKTARLNTTAFSAAATATSARLLDFALTTYYRSTEEARSWLADFLRRNGLGGWLNTENKWTIHLFDPTAACVGFFSQDWNIADSNPDADLPGRTSALSIGKPGAVYNEFFLRYGWSEPLQSWTKFVAATGRYLASGPNGSTNGSPGTTFTATGQTFQTAYVAAGHKLYVRSGTGAAVGVYTVSSVTSETVLVLATSPGNSLTDVEFYVGPDLDVDCVESFLKYGEIFTYGGGEGTDLNEVQDDATATAIKDALIDYYASEKLTLSFSTFFCAAHLEYRDLIYIDHPALPPDRAKVDVGGTLTSTITSSATSIAITGTLPAVNDAILIDNEVMLVTGNGSSPITVTRGYAGSVPAAHSAGATIYRLTTKWEVLARRERYFQHSPISLECREV